MTPLESSSSVEEADSLNRLLRNRMNGTGHKAHLVQTFISAYAERDAAERGKPSVDVYCEYVRQRLALGENEFHAAVHDAITVTEEALAHTHGGLLAVKAILQARPRDH